MHEGFIRGKETVAACEHVTLEPPLQRVLAEHFHDASCDVKLTPVGVFRFVFCKPGLLRGGVDRGEPVGSRFVRAEDTEGVHIAAHNFSKKVAKYVRWRCVQSAWSL